MGQPADLANEVCSNCGDLVAVLDEWTGWCYPCSGIEPTKSCIRCGADCEGVRCNTCKYLLWLDNNADEIERVMAIFGLKASRAKKVVIAQNRPNCLCCGKPINRGMKGRDLFCSTSAACVKAGTAYRYHKNIQRRTHADSLIRALTAAELTRLTENIHGLSNKST